MSSPSKEAKQTNFLMQDPSDLPVMIEKFKREYEKRADIGQNALIEKDNEAMEAINQLESAKNEFQKASVEKLEAETQYNQLQRQYDVIGKSSSNAINAKLERLTAIREYSQQIVELENQLRIYSAKLASVQHEKDEYKKLLTGQLERINELKGKKKSHGER